MPDLAIRFVSAEEDVTRYKRCYEEVWRQGQPFKPDELDPNDDALRFVATLGDETVGSFKVHQYRVTRSGAELDCAGIASVGILPAVRGQHFGAEMMRWSLHELRSRGFALAALYPFRGRYYRKFGYEFCGSRWQIKCPVPRLPKFRSNLPAYRVQVDEVAILDGCYRRFIAGFNGANVRSDAQWKLRMGKGSPLIYAVGDPIEAYAWISPTNGFWEELHVGEVAWSTSRGYESIMSVLCGLAVNQSHLVWSEPFGGPYTTRYLDQGASVELHRPAMYRILDAKACGLSGATVVDHDVPENNQTFGEPSLKGGIGAITQAFLGEPSLESLAASGAVTVIDWERARAAFPTKPVLCTEFF